MKTILIVIDGLGIGEMPDANLFGDEDSNTYLNIKKQVKFNLPNLEKLGINNIDGINLSSAPAIGNYARLSEITMAKDSTAGHYEMSGLILKNPYPVFKNGFPLELMKKLETATGLEFLGNEVASGTEIIKRLGQTHLETKKPIIYTSADSVLQIATHADAFNLEELYSICEKARKVCSGKYNVSRVIARPFATDSTGEFYRLDERKDYALLPPKKTMLDKLHEKGIDTVCIGKIEDIFCHRGISESVHTQNNKDGLKEILKQMERNDVNGLIFANLNDTDSKLGHRNNTRDYAKALVEIDNYIPKIIERMNGDDILMITADHGCDPTTISTDHSREFVPLLIYGKNLENNVNFGTIRGFDIISKTILNHFSIEHHEECLITKLKKKKPSTPTPHINALVGDFADTVIMPGDPLRSKMIAETFLENATLVNDVRGVQGYTGYYKGKKVSVMASGMGNASMGIYSYELFNMFDVKKIIRVGTIGAMREDIKLKELIIVKNVYSTTDYLDFDNKSKNLFIEASDDIVNKAINIAKKHKMTYHVGNTYNTDTFYTDIDQIALAKKHNLLGVEMEGTALYLNAKNAGKQALAICTVSDNIVTHESCSSTERQENFKNMVKIALELA